MTYGALGKNPLVRRHKQSFPTLSALSDKLARASANYIFQYAFSNLRRLETVSHFLLSNCNQYDKMQLFAKFKKFYEGGSEPPLNPLRRIF